MGIARPNNGHEVKLMTDFIDDRWRSIAVAERVPPGTKVVLDMGDERLAVEVIGIVGKDVCLWLGIEELEPWIT
jgi:hypothetical protein